MLNIKTFKVIDCENYIYIANKDKYAYELTMYLFDGKEPEKTNKREWYKLDKIPTEVLQKKPATQINKRYELKAGYTPTEMLPQIVTMEMHDTEEYDEVLGLYTYKYDMQDEGYESIDFTIETIYKRKDFEFLPNKFNANVDLLTQIEFPEEAYQDKPCQLSSEQVYALIRERVKRDIDNKVAKIKSDYDFHFEVVRKVNLDESYSYQYDANNSSTDKRRKPKWVNRMVTEKEVCILNLKRKSSDSSYGKECQLAPSITGENYEDLTKKVEYYLEELMNQINIKYCECPQCKGWGVVEVKDEI